MDSAYTPEPRYVSIDDWCLRTGLKRRQTYVLLGRSELIAIKVGKLTLIDYQHGLQFLDSRPRAHIRAPQPRSRASPDPVHAA